MITGGLIGCTAISVAWTLISSSSLRPSQRTPTSLKVNFCFSCLYYLMKSNYYYHSPNSAITRNLITLCKNWAGLARRALCFHGQTGKDGQNPNIDKIKIVCFRMQGGSNITLEYFRLLGSERMLKLYQIYRIDFEMFDYNIVNYETLFLWHPQIMKENIVCLLSAD